MGIAYAVSLDFLAGGSAGSSGTVVQDESVGVEVEDMAVKIGCRGERGENQCLKWRYCVFVGIHLMVKAKCMAHKQRLRSEGRSISNQSGRRHLTRLR